MGLFSKRKEKKKHKNLPPLKKPKIICLLGLRENRLNGFLAKREKKRLTFV